MNQSPEFSEFISKLESTITNGREEAKASKGSLERMRFAAIRKGQIQDAESISGFLGLVAKEIAFFRKAAHIVSPEHKKKWPEYIARFQRPLTPSTFEKIEEKLFPTKPFDCIEGFALPPSEKGSGEVGSTSIRGPFFAAVAANYSEAADLKTGTLVCLFSQSAKQLPKGDKPVVELRVWNMDSFANNLRGKRFDETSLIVPPEANETIIELYKKEVPELFKIAVQTMVRASLSNNPPTRVAEDLMELLNNYASLAGTPPSLEGPAL